MDKRAENSINELNKRIGLLQAIRDALIKKEKDRKAKAQEKWKAAFMKEMTKGIEGVCGENYEEDVSAEETAAFLAACLETIPRSGGEEAEKAKAADSKPVLTAILSKGSLSFEEGRIVIMSEVADACQIVMISGKMIAVAGGLSLKLAMLMMKVTPSSISGPIMTSLSW